MILQYLIEIFILKIANLSNLLIIIWSSYLENILSSQAQLSLLSQWDIGLTKFQKKKSENPFQTMTSKISRFNTIQVD